MFSVFLYYNMRLRYFCWLKWKLKLKKKLKNYNRTFTSAYRFNYEYRNWKIYRKFKVFQYQIFQFTKTNFQTMFYFFFNILLTHTYRKFCAKIYLFKFWKQNSEINYLIGCTICFSLLNFYVLTVEHDRQNFIFRARKPTGMA